MWNLSWCGKSTPKLWKVHTLMVISTPYFKILYYFCSPKDAIHNKTIKYKTNKSIKNTFSDKSSHDATPMFTHDDDSVGRDRHDLLHRCQRHAARRHSHPAQADASWYTIDGIRLNSKPSKKGLYIHNGRKTVVK